MSQPKGSKDQERMLDHTQQGENGREVSQINYEYQDAKNQENPNQIRTLGDAIESSRSHPQLLGCCAIGQSGQTGSSVVGSARIRLYPGFLDPIEAILADPSADPPIIAEICILEPGLSTMSPGCWHIRERHQSPTALSCRIPVRYEVV